MGVIGAKIKKQEYIEKANQAEQKYGLPNNLLVGLIHAESRFNPNAVSPAGAIGIAQFMPGTAKDFKIDPRNADQSIDAAGKYLSQNYKKLGNWDDTLRSYNMGLGNVYKWKQGKMKLPKETAEYVGKVHAGMGITGYKESFSENKNTYSNEVYRPYTPPSMIPKEDNVEVVLEDTPEESEAKEKIDKVTAEQQIIQDYFAQAQPQQQVGKQEQTQEPRYEAPSLGEQYTQVSQFIDTPIVQQGGKLDKTKEFTLEYIDSPKYRERLEKEGYKNIDAIIKERRDKVTLATTINQEGKPNVLEQFWNKLNNTPDSTQGSAYNYDTNTIIMDNKTDTANKITRGIGYQGVKAHELGHAELAGAKLNKKDTDELFNRLKDYKVGTNPAVKDDFSLEEREIIKKKAEKNDFRTLEHSYRPEENKSDLNALRFLLKQAGIYDAGKEDFKKSHLDKLKSNFIKDRLLENYKEDDLIWLMNNVAQQNNKTTDYYAQQGGSIPVSSQGVYDYPRQQVIVPTTDGNITMDKVNYPILGIDEYGNKQMMYPGKDYKFPGKIIHEIPQLKNYFNKR